MYNNYNQYYQPRFQPQPIAQTPEQLQPQYIQSQYNKPSNLQGKQVDSLDVVKATDVPLDGSVSYFPLTDGSAIITKQLQMDGTSKIVIFKPVNEEKEDKRFVTQDDLNDALNGLNAEEFDNIKEELSNIKKQLKKLEKVKVSNFE